LEAAGPLQVVHGELGARLHVGGGERAGVDPDRLGRPSPREGCDLLGRRAGTGEVASLAAERLPRHQRARAPRAQAAGGRHGALVGGGVAGREAAVGEIHEPVQQQAADQQPGGDHDDRPAEGGGGPWPHPVPQPRGRPAVGRSQRSGQGDQTGEDGHREHRQQRQQQHVGRGHIDQVAQPRLPPLSQSDRDQQRDRRRDGEDAPCPGPWRTRVAVGEGPPHPRPGHPKPVADGGGDAAHDALEHRATGQERRGEGQAREDQRNPCSRKRVPESAPPTCRRRR
jgi:hypothetical protein